MTGSPPSMHTHYYQIKIDLFRVSCDTPGNVVRTFQMDMSPDPSLWRKGTTGNPRQVSLRLIGRLQVRLSVHQPWRFALQDVKQHN